MNFSLKYCLWILLFISSGLISFPPLHYISNSLIILLFFLSLLKKVKTKLTYTSQFIISIAVISYINQLLYIGTYEWDKDSYTLLGTIAAIIAAERLYVPGKFFKLLILNSYSLIILFALGGITIISGRLYTEYLNPNIRGIFYWGGLNAALYYIFHKKKIKFDILLVLISSLSFLVITGSRRNLIYIIITFLFYIPSLWLFFKRTRSTLKKLSLISIFIIIGYFSIKIGLDTLNERFQNQNMITIVSDNEEGSFNERKSFLITSFNIAEKYPFGIGYGNIKEGMNLYGDKTFDLTQNSHALLAEIIISIGYLGILVFFIYIFKLTKLTRNNFVVWYFIPIYLIIALFTTSLLFEKLIWIVFVFAEKEIRWIQNIDNQTD